MEIERKWLFDSPTAAEEAGDGVLKENYIYAQGYLSVDPEVRIRMKCVDGKSEYVLCIKSKGSLERIEIEKELTEEEFDQLNSMIPYDLIVKDCNNYELSSGHILATGLADINEPTAFVYGEIEFDSVEEANAFVAPAWFGKEVTKDPEYKMANYWKRTRINK